MTSTPSIVHRGSEGLKRSLSRSSSTKRHSHTEKVDKGKQPERPPPHPLGHTGEHAPSITVLSPPPGENDEAVDDEDEEGWSSEGSIQSISKAHATGTGHNKSPPRRISSRVGGQVKNVVRSARKRGASFRKEHHHGSVMGGEDEEPRGRDRSSSVRGHGHGHGHSASAPSAPSLGLSHQGSGLASPRSRVGKLVSDSRGPTREPSPARSVRFVDGQSAGTRTPSRYAGVQQQQQQQQARGGSETPPSGRSGVPMSRQESWRST